MDADADASLRTPGPFGTGELVQVMALVNAETRRSGDTDSEDFLSQSRGSPGHTFEKEA